MTTQADLSQLWFVIMIHFSPFMLSSGIDFVESRKPESAIVSKLIDNSPCNTIRQIIRVRPPCSLAAPSKAALVPFPNGNGNPQS